MSAKRLRTINPLQLNSNFRCIIIPVPRSRVAEEEVTMDGRKEGQSHDMTTRTVVKVSRNLFVHYICRHGQLDVVAH